MLKPDFSNLVIPPWMKWIAALAVIVVVCVAIYGYGRQQFGLGEKAEKARWLARENAELVKANAEIKRLTDEKARLEAAFDNRVAEFTTKYLKESRDEKVKSDAVIADLRTGNAGLWYQLANREGTRSGRPGEAGPGAGGGDGGAEAELPREIGAALYSEADRSDQIVRQLGLCQRVVIEDRKLCGKQ